MAFDVGILRGFIELQDNFSSKFDKVGDKLVSSGDKIKKLGQNVSELGSTLTRSLTIPIVAIGGGAIKLASDFESSFAGVRKTVSATEDQFAELSQGFRDMSQEIPVNVNALNNIGEAAGQLGIKTENILSFTRVMADLGVTTDLSADQAASSLARLANITQMPQTEFDRLGSTIVALGNNFATTESQIVEMGLRIAGAGKQIGLTEGQILAISTALSSVGIEAEAGGSAISKVMIEMALSVSTGTGNLKNFASVAGMSTKEFQRAFRDDAATALNSFITGLGDMQDSGGDVLRVLDDMGISEVRMRDALLRTSGAGDLLTNALNLQAVAWSENTALTKEAEQRYGTFESKLAIFWNRLKDVGITLGQALLPLLADLLDMADPLIDMLASAARWFGDLPTPVKILAAGLSSLAAAAGPVLFIVGQLITAWGTFAASTIGASVIPRIASLLGLFTGPVGWIVLGGSLLLSWKPVREFLSDLASKVIKTLVDWVRRVIDWITDWWRSTDKLRKFLSELASVIWKDVVASVQKLYDWIRKIISWVGDLAVAVYNNIKAFVEWSGIMDGLITNIDLATESLRGLWDWVKTTTARVLDFVGGLEGLLQIVGVINPSIAISANKLKEWAEQAAINTKAAEDNERWQRAMDQAIKDSIPALDEAEQSMEGLGDKTEDAGNKVVAASGKMDFLHGSAEDMIVVVTDLNTEWGTSIATLKEVADGSGETRSSYDLLSQAANALADKLSGQLNPNSVEFVNLLRDLSTAADAAEGPLRDQLLKAMEDLTAQTESTGVGFASLGDSFSQAISAMVFDSASLSESLEGVFGSGARQSFNSFISDFISGFGHAIDSGKGAADAVAEGWEGSKNNIVGAANAIGVAMAAASGETEAMWIAAFSAIVNFATGNWVGAIIAIVGIVIGALQSSKKSVEELSGELDKLFTAITQGGEFAAQNLSEALVIMLDLIDEFASGSSTAMAEFKDNLTQFIDLAIDLGEVGINQLIAFLGQLEGTKAPLDAFLGHLDQVMGRAFEVMEERNQFLLDQSSVVLDGITAMFEGAGAVTAGEIEFGAEAVVAAFGRMLEAGMPLAQVLAELGDEFDLVSGAGEQMGLDLGDSFGRVGEMLGILADDHLQNVITRLTSMGDIATSVGNMGILSPEMLTEFGNRASNAFKQLTDSGLTSAEALSAIAPQLQQLRDLSEQYGFKLNANTQSLIDQADAQGLLSEKSLDANDIMIRGFDNLLRGINRLIEAMGGVPLAFDDWLQAGEAVDSGLTGGGGGGGGGGGAGAGEGSSGGGAFGGGTFGRIANSSLQVADTISTTATSAGNAWGDISTQMSGDWSTATDAMIGSINGLSTVAVDATDTIAESSASAADQSRLALIGSATDIGDSWTDILAGEVPDELSDAFAGIGQSWSDVTDEMETNAEQFATSTVDSADTATTAVIEYANDSREAFIQSSDDMLASWEGLAGAVPVAMSNAADAVSNTFRRMSGNMETGVGNAQKAWDRFMDNMMEDMGGSVVAEAIEQRTDDMANNMADSINGVGDKWDSTMESMKSSYDLAVEYVSDPFTVDPNLPANTSPRPAGAFTEPYFSAINPFKPAPIIPGTTDDSIYGTLPDAVRNIFEMFSDQQARADWANQMNRNTGNREQWAVLMQSLNDRRDKAAQTSHELLRAQLDEMKGLNSRLSLIESRKLTDKRV